MLNGADEARSSFLGVQSKERCVAAQERNQVEPIRNHVVAVGLDHLDVVRRQMRLGRDLIASQAFALASLGNLLAERGFGRTFRTGVRRLKFWFLVSHLQSVSPPKLQSNATESKSPRFGPTYL